MMDLTIYTVNADTQLLNGVLNGVAMVCQQVGFIWGFAVMVSMYRLLATATQGTVAAVGSGGGAVLASGFFGALVPLILAMLLTSPQAQSKVTVESSANGQTTVVDHVPFAIGVIPSVASVISKELGALVETAFQSVGTDYASISASGNGFINPLKVLLTSRTAMLQLGSIGSEVRTIMNSCLATDSGADYANINAMVLNAGNTGAKTNGSQTIDIAGTPGTAIGALLWQASQNTVGLVPDIIIDSQTISSCNSAANKVAQDITNALNSAEFPRVVQGSVNGMDQPLSTTDFSFNRFTQNYTAVRTADRTLASLVQGTTQANAEALNLLFSEMVSNSLQCLSSDFSTRTACQAALIQSNEVERNNIQAAAAEVPMLKYAGSFAYYLLALVIGLGPVIVLFMMFSGVSAGKNLMIIAHITVWPLLCMNVGAELINGMIYMSVAKFLASLAQGGYLSQAVTFQAYKEFSLQIGTASHLMASLPVIMSTIFAFGAAKTMASVQASLPPKSQETAEASTPKVLSSGPMVQQSSMYRAEQGLGFATGGFTGSMESVASSGQFAAFNTKSANTVSSALQRQHVLSEGESDVAAWKAASSSGVYKGHRIDKSLQEGLRTVFSDDKSGSEGYRSGSSVAGSSSNANTAGSSSRTAVSGGLSLGFGGKGSGPSAHIGLDETAALDLGTKASDSLSKTNDTGHTKQEEISARLSKVLDAGKSTTKSDNEGRQLSQDIAKSQETQKAYHQTLSESKSMNDVSTDAVEQSAGFVGLAAKIGTSEMAHAYNTVPEFRAFQLGKATEMEKFGASKPYLNEAREFVENSAGRDVLGDPGAKEAAIRHDAMVRMASDPDANAGDKLRALSYLNDEGFAIRGIGQRLRSTSVQDFGIKAPIDKTGVNDQALIKQADAKAPPVPAPPPAPKPANKISKPSKQAYVPRFRPTVQATVTGQAESRLRELNVRPDVEAGEARAEQSNLNTMGTFDRNNKNTKANIFGKSGKATNVSVDPKQ